MNYLERWSVDNNNPVGGTIRIEALHIQHILMWLKHLIVNTVQTKQFLSPLVGEKKQILKPLSY